VFNVITERSGKVARALSDDADVCGVAAIGSGMRTEEMMFMQTDEMKSFSNMMKGMNPIIVSRPLNADDAARCVLESAFMHNGQGISACSKVIVTANDQKAFTDALLKEVRKLRVGDPADMHTDIGPVISEENMNEFLSIAEVLKDSIMFGGKRIVNEETEFGYYVSPMIAAGLPRDHEFNNIDHGLPILSVQTAEDFEEALEMMNECEFGSTAGVYTKDDALIKRFASGSSANVSKYANGRKLMV
jgi:acyl-CoA reductase-like NAD-dependent aldehyde dehydrogenase